MTLNGQETLDAFREAVLAALDETAARVFAGSALIGRDPGATDADLPPLFQALDSHVNKLAERFGATLEW